MKRFVIAVSFAALGWAAGKSGSLLQQAPAKAALMQNPFQSDATASRAGTKLYKRECSACHGINREGKFSAPPLDGAGIRAASVGTLFWALRNGSGHRNMPSFAHLPEAQRWQIIGYLQGTTPDTM